MALKPCIDCNKPTEHTRCPTCQTARTQQRGHRTHYGGNWPTLSKQIRKKWVLAHGWTCPGWDRPPHPSTDLVVDHITPRDPRHLQVLCRTCNSRKSATERP